ncbi:NPC intracellular cholesterol transporter 2-like [Mercenaria mercenaria]|uniref:NPC intracellular cholesterol transporter 2-like n=1 Tax=Mercenaria mercenaria TaxID=6596 RepID=UPI00234F2BC4|nr:NPC intracellular cholesterol transporter 2-like [Mercenaria mercenaria]
MLKFTFLAFFAFYAASSSFAVKLRYTDCGSSADVHSITLEPCSQDPCVIHQQQNYTAHISFTPKANHDKAYNFATGIIFGSPQPFAVSPKDACGNGVHCPLQAGLIQTYTASVLSPITDPKRVAAKWEVKDENDQDIICFVFPVVIVWNKF